MVMQHHQAGVPQHRQLSERNAAQHNPVQRSTALRSHPDKVGKPAMVSTDGAEPLQA